MENCLFCLTAFSRFAAGVRPPLHFGMVTGQEISYRAWSECHIQNKNKCSENESGFLYQQGLIIDMVLKIRQKSHNHRN
jgi:hypothetical protein